MVTPTSSSGQEPYPGLEVVPAERANRPHLHARLEQYSQLEQNEEPYSRLEVNQTYSKEKYPLVQEGISTDAADDERVPSTTPGIVPTWRRRRNWIVGLLIAAVVVIAAVLGGVLGTQLHKHHADRADDPAASATMTGSATLVSAYSYPTAVSFGSPHVEVFALNPQLQPLWKYRNTSTSWYPQSGGLQPLGGTATPFTQGIAAITRGEDNVHLFRAGSLNGSLFYKSHSKENYTWSPSDDTWDSVGGILSTAPSAVSYNPDRFDVFALGAGPRYQLFQITWNATTGWTDWFGMSDGSWQILPPTVVSWSQDRFDVFLLNNGNALQHTYWNGSSTWLPSGSYEDLGGFCTSRPTAVSRAPGLIDVFVRGGNSGLWQLSYSQEEWGEWVAVDPEISIQSDPEAVSCGSDELEVFAWASNSSLLYKKWEVSSGNGTWTPSTGFQVLGDGLTGPPKAVCDGQGSLHVFAYLDNRRVGHLAWNDTAGLWSPATGFEIIGTM